MNSSANGGAFPASPQNNQYATVQKRRDFVKHNLPSNISTGRPGFGIKYPTTMDKVMFLMESKISKPVALQSCMRQNPKLKRFAAKVKANDGLHERPVAFAKMRNVEICIRQRYRDGPRRTPFSLPFYNITEEPRRI